MQRKIQLQFNMLRSLKNRQRGYKVGSLKTGIEEPDRYYKQPGHPLSDKADKGGRFADEVIHFCCSLLFIILVLW